MLNTVTPKQFDEWIAYKSLEPDKLDRLRVILTTGLLVLCNSWGCKIEPKDLDPMWKDEAVPEVSPDQAAAMMKAAYPGEQM